MIKEYIANYFLHMSDVTFDMRTNEVEVHQSMQNLGALP
jgi:glucose-1-phosphate cytidylyltransferase